MEALCHVWTAPAVQEESDVSANGRVRSCIRPVVAAALAAGHDVIRGSGPNQKHALVSRVAQNGLPDQRSTVSHHVYSPLQTENATLGVTWLCSLLLYDRNLSSSGSSVRLNTVDLLLGQNCPGDASGLVGDGNRNDLCWLARQ